MWAPLGIAQVKKKGGGESFKEAGAKLGQAQLKLGLYFTSISVDLVSLCLVGLV